MPSCGPDRCGDRGFSLLETLVALVIVGMALTAIAGVFGDGLRGHRTSEAAATALSLAEATITSAEATGPLRPGHSEGFFAGRFHWAQTISPYEDRPDDLTKSDQPGSSLRLYQISVEVAWRDGVRQGQLVLATLRLGPAPP